MGLNKAYYESLLNKFVKKDLQKKTKNIIALLSSQIILKNYRKYPVCFNFPLDNNSFQDTIELLYKELSNHAYRNFATFPILNDGDKVKDRTAKHVGKPNLDKITQSAIERAKDCSLDPICYGSDGQGVAHLNLAACHSCTLVPETTCELSNLFLDRKLLIDKNFGFFKERF